MTDEPKTKESQTWLYVGMRPGEADSFFHRFERVERAGTGWRKVEDLAFFEQTTKGKLGRAMPAWVYSVDVVNGSTFNFGTLEMIERWQDNEEAEAILLTARGHARQITAQKAAKKMSADLELLRESLAPIRRQYNRTNLMGRIAIEMLVLQALRKGL